MNYRKPKSPSKDVKLTNNFHANLVIQVLGNVALFIYIATSSNSILSDENIAHFMVFNLSYFLTSYWFSPDLDVATNRPGKGSFPFKAVLIKLNKLKKLSLIGWAFGILQILLQPIHIVLNYIWKSFWQPFADLFTHRGAVHIPVFGTQLKIVYVFTIYWCALYVANLFGLDKLFILDLANLPLSPKTGNWYKNLFKDNGLYDLIINNPLLLNAWISMMIADICHIAVDWWDSLKKGSNFIPPAFIAPRGLFSKVIKFILDLIIPSRLRKLR